MMISVFPNKNKMKFLLQSKVMSIIVTIYRAKFSNQTREHLVTLRFNFFIPTTKSTIYFLY